MATGGQAFFKGGFGCIALFFVVGILCVAIGGHMYVDLGGLLILLVIGGVIGLIINAVYNKGRREALRDEHLQEGREVPPQGERTDEPHHRPHPDDLV